MNKFSLSKEKFEDILLKKINILKIDSTKYWKKEFLEPKIINNKISYSIKQIDKIILSNGLGKDKPQIIVECSKVEYSNSEDCFKFYLGKIIEEKNIKIEENYKDSLIERLIQEKLHLEESLNKDHLTQVYNRRKMESDLSKFITQKNAFMLNAIFIDVDRFKGINDNFGHEVGDRVLKHIASRLQYFTKKLNAEVYRYGGEEFVILSFMAKDRMMNILEELKLDIKSQRVYHPKRDISVTISMGISYYDDYKNKDIFLQKADEAVYKAKQNGRDRIEFAIKS